ncbi:MAG: surface adhesion protein [Thermoleophilales bacterium]|jgi:hypothetical protein|nr:surface adhesion protein [Thermoleophilales bacterium]
MSKRKSLGAVAVLALSAAIVAPASHSQPAPATCNGKAATIVAPEGGLIVNGSSKADVIVGTAGDDFIRGNGGNDLICGGDGNDSLLGGSGNDTLYGEAGKDTLIGGGGTDKLHGGPGADTCKEARKTKKC